MRLVTYLRGAGPWSIVEHCLTPSARRPNTLGHLLPHRTPPLVKVGRDPSVPLKVTRLVRTWLGRAFSDKVQDRLLVTPRRASIRVYRSSKRPSPSRRRRLIHPIPSQTPVHLTSSYLECHPVVIHYAHPHSIIQPNRLPNRLDVPTEPASSFPSGRITRITLISIRPNHPHLITPIPRYAPHPQPWPKPSRARRTEAVGGPSEVLRP